MIHRITESQNYRMVGVGRDLCGSSVLNPLWILCFECRTGAPNPNQEGPVMTRLTYFFVGKIWKASK